MAAALRFPGATRLRREHLIAQFSNSATAEVADDALFEGIDAALATTSSDLSQTTTTLAAGSGASIAATSSSLSQNTTASTAGGGATVGTAASGYALETTSSSEAAGGSLSTTSSGQTEDTTTIAASGSTSGGLTTTSSLQSLIGGDSTESSGGALETAANGLTLATTSLSATDLQVSSTEVMSFPGATRFTRPDLFPKSATDASFTVVADALFPKPPESLGTVASNLSLVATSTTLTVSEGSLTTTAGALTLGATFPTLTAGLVASAGRLRFPGATRFTRADLFSMVRVSASDEVVADAIFGQSVSVGAALATTSSALSQNTTISTATAGSNTLVTTPYATPLGSEVLGDTALGTNLALSAVPASAEFTPGQDESLDLTVGDQTFDDTVADLGGGGGVDILEEFFPATLGTTIASLSGDAALGTVATDFALISASPAVVRGGGGLATFSSVSSLDARIATVSGGVGVGLATTAAGLTQDTTVATPKAGATAVTTMTAVVLGTTLAVATGQRNQTLNTTAAGTSLATTHVVAISFLAAGVIPSWQAHLVGSVRPLYGETTITIRPVPVLIRAARPPNAEMERVSRSSDAILVSTTREGIVCERSTSIAATLTRTIWRS